ncbi:MAG: hypothetical protein WCP93_00450 [Candidatus Berkelbacteria bacterium]
MNLLSPVDFKKLVDTNWIFEIKPNPQGEYLYLAVVFGFGFILALILSFTIDLIQKEYRKFYAKIMYLLYTICSIGLILIVFRWQNVAYLGSRFGLYLLFVFSLYWLIDIIIYRLKVVPMEIKKKRERERFEKYLPKAKKK